MPTIPHSKWKWVIGCAIVAFWFATTIYTLVQRKPDFASAWNDYKAALITSAACFLVFLVAAVFLALRRKGSRVADSAEDSRVR